MPLSEQRWLDLCAALQVTADRAEFARLSAAYGEPQRAYHTQQHLAECLAKLDWAVAQGYHSADSAKEHVPLAEAALWYHDAVYRPRAQDNELRSADWAVRFFRQAGLAPRACERLHAAIMATGHGTIPQDLTARLVVDIDLAILGADESRFAEYESQVRREYRWVPWPLYKRKRSAVLKSFLDRPRIYSIDLFYDELEQPARANLAKSLAKLAARGFKK